MAPEPARPDLPALLDSWIIDLKAARKAEMTISQYVRSAKQFLAWCDATGHPQALDKRTVNAWLAELLDRGLEGTTVAARQLGVRRYSAWLAAEREIEEDLLIGLTRPALDVKVVEPLTVAELGALMAACAGTDFRARRDEAIVRFLAETGARAGELINMEVDDIDAKSGVAVVRRGKGGKGRRVPYGPQTSRALDRYLRARRTHKLAARPKLWLGDRNRGLTYDGMRLAILGRAQAAGVANFHPHRLRHTLADRWLEAGGSEGGLMSIAGWSDSTMLRRYTKAREGQRAADEARRLNLGDL